MLEAQLRLIFLTRVKTLGLAHSLVELVNTSACINELLLACVERVAVGADIYSQVALRRHSLECVTASASYCYQLCLGMNAFFHCFHLSIKDMTRGFIFTYAIPDF